MTLLTMTPVVFALKAGLLATLCAKRFPMNAIQVQLSSTSAPPDRPRPRLPLASDSEKTQLLKVMLWDAPIGLREPPEYPFSSVDQEIEQWSTTTLFASHRAMPGDQSADRDGTNPGRTRRCRITTSCVLTRMDPRMTVT